MVNVKLELVGKEKCDEQHQKTRKREQEKKDEVSKVKEQEERGRVECGEQQLQTEERKTCNEQ